MCQQVQTVTLQTAVLTQVKEFAQNNQSFSAHDITLGIRTKTGNGELEIPEVEVSGESFRFKIEHEKVKGLFDEMWRSGVFDAEFTLARQFNGTYYEYTPTLVGGYATAQVASVPAPVPVAVPPQPQPHNYGLVPTAMPASVTTPSDITARISLYLGNCTKRNFRPTLKQVQSAIKRGEASTGHSCDVLKATIQGLGYVVVDDPESLSRAQVATV